MKVVREESQLMRTVSFIGGFFAILTLFTRCTSEDVQPKESYFPMTIGSYWVYEWFMIDLDGHEEQQNIFDTLKIKGDTILNGHTYFVQDFMEFGDHIGDRFLRDSSGYLVDHRGRRYFTSNLTMDTLYTLYVHGELNAYSIMDLDPEDVSVPAGNFETRVAKVYIPLEFALHPDNPRISKAHYAKDVGNVLQTAFYLAHTGILERRLIEYHIE